MNAAERRKLKTRYLIWLYKITKEELDSIERKFTQLEIDRSLLKELKRQNSPVHKAFIDEFQTYIQNKEKQGLSLKYQNGRPKAEFLFLESKLRAVEKTIKKELGWSALRRIKSLYEKEMIERIIKSTEHK